MNQEGQVSVEYLIILAAVLVISVVVVVLARSSVATNTEEVSILSCQSAARECAFLRRANVSIECDFCAEECVNVGDEELYPGAISCCIAGNVNAIYADSVEVCTHNFMDCVDNDEDGFDVYDGAFCPTGTDCNDLNPNINPAMAENCTNWFDDNCNGFNGCEDPACSLDNYCLDQICEDGDFDGFWAEDGSECPIQEDCNDTNSLINPSVTEICDDFVDNNCDGLIDCADSNCIGDPACP